MYQALRVRDREKRPQPTCKKHRSKYPLRKKLASMSESKKKEYFENRKKEFLKRKEERKKRNLDNCKRMHMISKKTGRKKKTKTLQIKQRKSQQQIIHTRKSSPSMEVAIIRKLNERQRKIKRRLIKIIHYAKRMGVDYMIVVKKLFSDFGLRLLNRLTQIKTIAKQLAYAGVQNIPISKYQKMILQA